MLPEKYPDIKVYWSFEKNKIEEYKSAFSRLVVGQINAFGDITVGIAIVEGTRRSIPIVIDNGALLSQISAMLCGCGLITDDYFPIIIFDEKYYRRKEKKPTVLDSVYHELGHLYLKHLERNAKSKDENGKERTERMENGEVFWQEKEADTFACHYIGKDAMIEHLIDLKKAAIELANKDKDLSFSLPYIQTELKKRIEFIKEL